MFAWSSVQAQRSYAGSTLQSTLQGEGGDAIGVDHDKRTKHPERPSSVGLTANSTTVYTVSWNMQYIQVHVASVAQNLLQYTSALRCTPACPLTELEILRPLRSDVTVRIINAYLTMQRTRRYISIRRYVDHSEMTAV